MFCGEGAGAGPSVLGSLRGHMARGWFWWYRERNGKLESTPDDRTSSTTRVTLRKTRSKEEGISARSLLLPSWSL